MKNKLHKVLGVSLCCLILALSLSLIAPRFFIGNKVCEDPPFTRGTVRVAEDPPFTLGSVKVAEDPPFTIVGRL